MNLKHFSRAQFSKGTGLMGLESSGTILYVAKILHRHTHTHTHMHTDRHTRTCAETNFISLVFLRKCRNKTNETKHNTWG